MIEKPLRELTVNAKVIGIGTQKINDIHTKTIAVYYGGYTVNIYAKTAYGEYQEVKVSTFGHNLNDTEKQTQKAIENMKNKGFTVYSKE